MQDTKQTTRYYQVTVVATGAVIGPFRAASAKDACVLAHGGGLWGCKETPDQLEATPIKPRTRRLLTGLPI